MVDDGPSELSYNRRLCCCRCCVVQGAPRRCLRPPGIARARRLSRCLPRSAQRFSRCHQQRRRALPRVRTRARVCVRVCLRVFACVRCVVSSIEACSRKSTAFVICWRHGHLASHLPFTHPFLSSERTSLKASFAKRARAAAAEAAAEAQRQEELINNAVLDLRERYGGAASPCPKAIIAEVDPWGTWGVPLLSSPAAVGCG